MRISSLNISFLIGPMALTGVVTMRIRRGFNVAGTSFLVRAIVV